MVFADDTQIYLQCAPQDILHRLSKIRDDVSTISEFASSNFLSLNVAKSKILIFGSSAYIRSLNYSSLPPIVINDIILPYVSEARNLGVHFSSDLS